MKKSILSILCIALLTALSGCMKDSDVLGNGNEKPDAEKGFGYVAFSIKVDAAVTRSDDDEYAKGDAAEYARCPDPQAHRAFFFTDDGKYVSSAFIADNGADGKGHDSNHGSGSNYGDKEEIYYAYVMKNEAWDNSFPTKVLVVLNGNPTNLNELDNALKTGGLNTALQWLSVAETAPGVSKAAIYEGYFTMSNSTFIPDGGDTGTLQTATAIEKTNFHQTIQEAINDPVTIYVERVAAKFSVSYKGSDIITGQIIEPTVFDKNGTERPADQLQVVEEKGFDVSMMRIKASNRIWKIKVEAWGLNALEQNTFLFKNLAKAKPRAWTISEEEKFYTGWNAASYHRSYWAVDPHYDETGYDFISPTTHYYPKQYRPVNGQDDGEKEPSLKYVAYNNIGEDNYSPEGSVNKYTLENTFAYAEALKNYAPLRYGTHILLKAKLLIEGLNDTENTKDTDLYLAYSVFWENKDNYMQYAYQKMCASYADGKRHEVKHWKTGEDIELPIAEDKKLYKDKEGKEAYTPEKAIGYLTLAAADIEGGDGMLIMEKKDDNNKFYCKYEETEEGQEAPVVKFHELTSDEIKSLMYEFTDPVQHFTKGSMCYAIPINHNNIAQKLTGAEDADDYKLGDFGVVRNHWYAVNVKGIGTVGTPVDDPDQPVVPSDPDIDYNIGLEIKVLPWRVVGGEADDRGLGDMRF